MTQPNNTKFKAFQDKIFVKRLETEEKSPGGIIIPDSAKEKSLVGKVVSVGSGIYNQTNDKVIPLSVKIGDIVLFTKWGATETSASGEEYTILKESDILGIQE